MEKEEKVRRRYFTRDQKAEIVRAFYSGCTHPALIYKWRKKMKHQETSNKSIEHKELLSELDDRKLYIPS